MIGYLFVLISALSGAGKGYLGKTISAKTNSYKASVFVNLIRMLLCIAISVITEVIERGSVRFQLDGAAVLYGTMTGIFMSVFVVSWLLCIQRDAFMLVSVAQMFGVIVTLLLSFVVFRENVTPKQVLGIAFLTAAVLCMLSYSAKIKGNMTVTSILLLLLCGVSSGLLDFSQKLYTAFSQSSVSALNLLTYASGAVFLTLCFTGSKPQTDLDCKALLKETFVALFLMAICLFANSYFKAFATKFLTAAQIYPVYQSITLILRSSMSALCFKEKLTVRSVVGIILAFMALVFINM
ncbi:MAG: EamA family transporter [Clostridia bacterium]|nr:EamA family transporter [Clostridia bacterium]